jgi:hypothetical protein
VWSRETGAALALAAAIVQITGWGFVAGAGGTLLRAGLLAAVEGLLGIMLLPAAREAGPLSDGAALGRA